MSCNGILPDKGTVNERLGGLGVAVMIQDPLEFGPSRTTAPPGRSARWTRCIASARASGVRRYHHGSPTATTMSKSKSAPGPTTPTALAKLRAPAAIAVSMSLVRLYSDDLHAECVELDSDYVFVNLWGGRRGRPPQLRHRAHPGWASGRVSRSRHQLRHIHATDLIRRGVPIEVGAAHPPLVDHHPATLCPQRVAMSDSPATMGAAP